MSKCYFCGGKTRIKKIDVDFRWGDKLFVIQNVPVEICTKCGERYYSAKVSHKMDKIVQKSLKKEKKPKQILEVPVFNFGLN